MARFYADIQGNRGQATRMGTAKTGINGHIRGWNIGAKVEVNPSPDNPDTDMVEIWLTSGSIGDKNSRFLGRFTRADLEDIP